MHLKLQFHENCSIDPKFWTPFFWDQSVLLVIILQLYDDIMIFQYKTTTLKHNRTWTPTPSPNGLGRHIKVGQETQEGCSKSGMILWIPILSLMFPQSWKNPVVTVNVQVLSKFWLAVPSAFVIWTFPTR